LNPQSLALWAVASIEAGAKVPKCSHKFDDMHQIDDGIGLGTT